MGKGGEAVAGCVVSGVGGRGGLVVSVVVGGVCLTSVTSDLAAGGVGGRPDVSDTGEWKRWHGGGEGGMEREGGRGRGRGRRRGKELTK